jgi:hypothetical protein
MRNYPIDSRQAQGRIIAAALLADGGLDKSEIEFLDCRSIYERLDLSQSEFNTIVHEFWNDMNIYALRSESGELQIGREAIASMLADIRTRSIQIWLLGTIHELVYADKVLSAGEALLVSQMMSDWGITLLEVKKPVHNRASQWPPQLRRAAADACS